MSYRKQNSLLPPSSYDVLGVASTASDMDIKLAYKRLVLEWHPDKGLHDRTLAEQNLKSINEAYSRIKTKYARDQYNQILRLQKKADALSRSKPTTWGKLWNWLTKLESNSK